MFLNMAGAEPDLVFKTNLQLPYYIIVRLGMWLHTHAEIKGKTY